MKLVFIITLVIFNIVYKCSSICTPVYGREPCTFTPAPPGHVPSCARPGLTYCEHPPQYPGQLIQHLLEKWKYDHATLLSDESQDDFNSYFISSDSKYSPNSIYGAPNSIHPDSYFPEPIHIPKPPYPTFYPSGNTYIPPPTHNHSHFAGYPDRRPSSPPFFQPHIANQLLSYRISKNPYVHSQYSGLQNTYKLLGQPQIIQYHQGDWWKRYARDDKLQRQLRRKRAVKIKENKNKLLYGGSPVKNGTDMGHRITKRQNSLSGQTLCETTSSFIMPRAALNNKGNWMYVVNMPELDNRYTQLVKSETCSSTQCNGLCTLPAGYTSRCEQKYVQKRLVALEGGGNQLYTDVFWIPSCCICTITTN